MIYRPAIGALIISALLSACASVEPGPNAPASANAKPASANTKPAQIKAPVEPANMKIEYENDFSNGIDAYKEQINGGDPELNEEANTWFHPFAGVPEEAKGQLKTRLTESQTLKGPDGKTGVLTFSIETKPDKADYFGFIIWGHADGGDILMNSWPAPVTHDVLARTWIRFQYRAANSKNPGKIGCQWNFRFEPELDDAYPKRADFGTLEATGQWQHFSAPLAQATNLEAFIKAVNEGQPEKFKLSFGQQGPVSNYDVGDTLVIDDIQLLFDVPAKDSAGEN